MCKDLLTTKELCDRLKVTRQAISLWVRTGCPVEIKYPRRYDWEKVKTWLNDRSRGV